MIVRIILSVVVAIVVGVVIKLVGAGLLDAGVANTGAYLNAVAVLLGICAGVWYFFAGKYPTGSTYER